MCEKLPRDKLFVKNIICLESRWTTFSASKFVPFKKCHKFRIIHLIYLLDWNGSCSSNNIVSGSSEDAVPDMHRHGLRAAQISAQFDGVVVGQGWLADCRVIRQLGA